MDGFVDKLLYPNVQTIDWKVLKKALSVKIFSNNKLLAENPMSLNNAIGSKVTNSMEIAKQSNNQFSTKLLGGLSSILENSDEIDVMDFIILCRFDKGKYKLPQTVIIGDDGGLYGLLNSADAKSKQLLENITSQGYLADKTKGQNKLGQDKIVIGKGGFGTVRFAVSLSEEKATKSGDIICIKKSKNLGQVDLENVQNSTLSDYLSDQFADFVRAPKIYDMAIINTFKHNKHDKGYIKWMLCQKDTGARVFKKPEYQKWEHQNPYLLGVFRGIQTLLNR